LQLRADARPWPDSTVTYTAAGERISKTVYTYDAAGRHTLSEGYRWEGGAWVNSSKNVFAYDAAGRHTLYEYYRWENNRWTGSSKHVYAYDDRGVEILYEYYQWTNNQWRKSNEEHYDRKTVDSKVYIRVNVSYSEDGSRSTGLLVSGSGLSWTFTVPEKSEMEYKATYDSDDNLTLVETTVLLDGKRVPNDRYVIKYSNNNPVSIELYRYNGNDVGEIFYKAVNTYDAGGNRTLSEVYKRNWDPGSGEYKLVNLTRSVATYDADGNELSSEYYSWNTSSGGWIGGSKTVYERNGYGDIILDKYYLWNNGWVYDSYTVYYPGEGSPDATERIGEAEPVVYIHDGVLYIQTVHAERIFIYSATGSKVYEGSIPAGASALSAGRLPKGVLIVKGSSGWTEKIVRR
jgi:hypothetical protein